MSWDDKNWKPTNYNKLDEEAKVEPASAPLELPPAEVVLEQPAVTDDVAVVGDTTDGADATYTAEDEQPDHEDFGTLANRYTWWFLSFLLPMTVGGLWASNTYYTVSLHQSATSAYQLSQPSLFNLAVVTFVFKGLAFGLAGLAIALGSTRWTEDKMKQLASVAGLMGLAGLLLLTPPAHEMYWPQTLGEVGHIEPSDQSTDEIVVVFGYVIRGELHKSPNYTSKSLTPHYPDGRKVKVFYDPKNARYARIEKVWTVYDYLIAVPTVMLLLLWAFLVFSKLAKREPRAS